MNQLQNQSGVSMMEILVTVLILGIGLLGTAALQVTSLNSNQSGYYRSQATAIAEDLASKLRVSRMTAFEESINQKSAFVYGTHLINVLNAYQGAPYVCGVAPAQDCNSGVCNAAQLVAFDQWEVCSAARLELPEGEVYFATAAGIRAQIAVAWTPVESRTDLGQVAILNNQCAALGIVNKDCVILEVIP